jgi:GNAT superfamily N-acetyltransferase
LDIRHKDVADLTDAEFTACEKATFGWEGMMQGELRRCRREGYGKAVMLWKTTATTKTGLIGWALLTPVRLYGDLAATRWTMKVSKYTVEFYVKPEHREKGHGTTLVKLVKEHYDPRPHVLPHDRASSELFSKFDVMVMREDSHWIRHKTKIA